MRTLVVGAAIVDLMMKVERLPKSGEDIPCKETKTVVGGCAYNVANTLRNLKCELIPVLLLFLLLPCLFLLFLPVC